MVTRGRRRATLAGQLCALQLVIILVVLDALSEQRTALDLVVTTLFADPTIPALLMAKAATANERRIDLTIADDSRLERLEAHDTADVATVLGNLVDNAFDHAPKGPATTPSVRIRIRQDASTVEIVVDDSGPGVPDELRESLFEHGVTTKRVDPLEHGVGLALTRLVCRRRGGEIDVERLEGTTRFTARLGVSTFVDPQSPTPGPAPETAQGPAREPAPRATPPAGVTS